MAVTRIVVNITRHETCTYMIGGTVDATRAVELIASGEYDPIDSRVHVEDIDVVEIETKV